MTLVERLRWASAPIQRRSLAFLWGGLAAFLAAGWLFTVADLPGAAGLLLYPLLVASWVAAMCGAIGYVRWMLGEARADAAKEGAPPRED